jgi:16S rRNA (cytosine967-C5)-methyltransferase
MNFPLELPESERNSIKTSHPEWLLDRWAQQFGKERSMSIAEANNEAPRLALRMTRRGIDRQVDISAGVRQSMITEGAFTADRLTPELKDLAERGEVYFQDEGSQLVANSVSIPKDGKFLDVCAAPGGKTTQIAARSVAMIVAGDLHRSRVEFLRANALSQGVPDVSIVRYDAEAALPFADESFDAILLDAPCSGTGTIRSNPELRYFLDPADISQLSSKQLTILKNASKLMKKGGVLYYSTCSLEREENEEVIKEFLTLDTGFSISERDVDQRFVTPDGFMRTYPDRDGTDGFFLAILRRDQWVACIALLLAGNLLVFL